MPPLPPSFDESTSGAMSAIQRRRTDLEEFQIPRLQNCRESLVVQQQYAAELREDLDGLARLIEALDETVEDQRSERTRRDLKGVVDGFHEDLGRLRKSTRAALLSSKRAIDARSSSSREELLRSSVMKEQQTSEEKTQEDALMKAHNDVTDALRRTMGLMQGELERSVLSVQMLESSTTSMKSTSTTQDVLTNLLGTSKQLVTALEKSDWLDRLLILSALAFFLLIVLFILKQRIFDRGFRLAFWWTRFLPSRSPGEAAVLDKLEKGNVVRTTAAVSSTVLASISTALAQASQVAAPEPLQDFSSSATEETSSISDVLSSIANPPSDAPTPTPRADYATSSSVLPHDEL